jgi:hypothetical protein
MENAGWIRLPRMMLAADTPFGTDDITGLPGAGGV